MTTKTKTLFVSLTNEADAALNSYAVSRRLARSAVARIAINEFLLRNGLLADMKQGEVLAWSKELISRKSEKELEAYMEQRRNALKKARAAKKL